MEYLVDNIKTMIVSGLDVDVAFEHASSNSIYTAEELKNQFIEYIAHGRIECEKYCCSCRRS